MKLYTVYTDSHVELFEKYFKPSIDSSFELVSFKQNIQGNGDYCSKGYMESLVDKTRRVVQSIKDNWGEVIAWADVDIIFNGLTSDILLKDFNDIGKDIAFSRLEIGGDSCFGFYVMRCNDKTLWLWDNILKRSIERPHEYDQVIGHHFMREEGYDPGYLDYSYHNICFRGGDIYNSKMVHFACCSSVQQKINTMNKFLLEKLKIKFSYHNDRFCNIFRNKKVSIVAGGGIENSYGKEIDEDSDIVIRLNEYSVGYPFSDSFVEKYGSRADILFRERNDIMKYHGNDNWPDKYIESLKSCGIKDVFFFNGNGDAYDICEDLSGHGIRFDYIDDSVFKFLKAKMIDKIPTTGLVCISAISLCDPNLLP